MRGYLFVIRNRSVFFFVLLEHCIQIVTIAVGGEEHANVSLILSTYDVSNGFEIFAVLPDT